MSDATDWIGAVGGFIGAAAGVWAIVTGQKAEEAKKKAEAALTAAEKAQSRAQTGWLELQLRVFISSRRDKIHDTAKDLEAVLQGRAPKDVPAQDAERMRPVMLRYESAHEDFLGAVDQACRHYRDKKINAKSFRRMYEQEIRDLTIESEKDGTVYNLMYPREKSKFQEIWLVHDEWFKKD